MVSWRQKALSPAAADRCSVTSSRQFARCHSMTGRPNSIAAETVCIGRVRSSSTASLTNAPTATSRYRVQINFIISCYIQADNDVVSSLLSMIAVHGRHDVGQGNVNILQHLQSNRRSGASTNLSLNRPIQFYLNNVTNLHQLTLHSTTPRPTTWRSYRDHRLLWRHFTLSTVRMQ